MSLPPSFPPPSFPPPLLPSHITHAITPSVGPPPPPARPQAPASGVMSLVYADVPIGPYIARQYA